MHPTLRVPRELSSSSRARPRLIARISGRDDAKAASEQALREALRKKNLFKAVGKDLTRGNMAMDLFQRGGMKQKRRRQRKEAREAKRFNAREKKARAKLLERQRRAREKANAMANLDLVV